MTFRVVTFGDLRLTDSVSATVPYPEKALIAICYLLTAKGFERTRSDVAQFLWGSADSRSAMGNLRTLLSRVKNRQAEIGRQLIIARDLTIAIDPALVEGDFVLLGQDMPNSEALLKTFLQQCHGVFLADADDLSERGRDWITAQRESLADRISHTLDEMSDSDLGVHHMLVQESAYRLMQIEPQREAAYRALMRIHLVGGHPNAARATLERLKDRLKQDVGAAPERSTLALLPAIATVEPQPRVTGSREEGGGADAGYRRHLPRVALLRPTDIAGASLVPGLIEDVTLGLCSFKTIAMIAPHTADRIAIATDRAVAYEQHTIRYALDTRVRTQDGHESIFAQLVDIRNDSVIWADRFDAGVASLPRQYRAMASRIIASVTSGIEEMEIERLGCEQHPNAYQYYLMGQRFLKRIDLPDIRRARKAFRQAMKEDRRFSAALAGLARADHLEWLLTARGDVALLKSSEFFARDAIRVQDGSPGGYRELGVAKLYQHQFDESIEAFEKAEAASPCHADMIADYADTLVHASDPVRGLAKIESALELNPLAPDVYYWTAAGANYCLERYETALDRLGQMEEQGPASRVAAACWGMLGDRKKAQFYRRKALAIHPDFNIETWLSIMPVREQWQKEQYREGLRKAGFA